MNGEIRYRRAAVGDVRAIAAMERGYFGRHAFGPGMLLYLLWHAGDGFRVAAIESEVVGYAVVCRRSLRRGHAELSTFAVREDLRNRGVGSQLMSQALAHLAAAKVKRVNLQVSVRNSAACRLYERFGFRVASTLRGYYGGGEDAWLMVCSLEGRGARE
ncbi:MAG TPA: GNAT family N-acetyltransferase [Armatimonadota bacterium]|nr:GNAT family N-acetyltransferase [Armatimonadota bacterium]